ncbi:MAG: hypothetical protein Q9187_006128 [Circinaria calcarea]
MESMMKVHVTTPTPHAVSFAIVILPAEGQPSYLGLEQKAIELEGLGESIDLAVAGIWGSLASKKDDASREKPFMNWLERQVMYTVRITRFPPLDDEKVCWRASVFEGIFCMRLWITNAVRSAIMMERQGQT